MTSQPMNSSADLATSTPSVGRTAAARTRPAAVRERARCVLRSGGCRLHFLLCYVVVLTMAVGLYLAISGIYLAGVLVFGEVVWLDVACNALLVLALGLVVLPLITSIWEIACRMVAARDPDPETSTSARFTPALRDLFAPFASPQAYGRTMVVALEVVAWLAVILGLPVVLWRVAALPFADYAGMSAPLARILPIALRILSVPLGLGAFLLSCRRVGFGYHVFANPELSLNDAARFFRTFKRPILPALCLRLSMVGWMLLSVLGILLPFIFYTLPYATLSAAVYGRTLERK